MFNNDNNHIHFSIISIVKLKLLLALYTLPIYQLILLRLISKIIKNIHLEVGFLLRCFQ